MRRDALKGLLQIGFFLTGLSFCSLIFQPPGSGEFVVSACSMGIGLTVLLLAAVVVLMMR